MLINIRFRRLSKDRSKRLAEICMGIGHIALGVVVVPALIDKFNSYLIILGLVLAITFWVASVLIER